MWGLLFVVALVVGSVVEFIAWLSVWHVHQHKVSGEVGGNDTGDVAGGSGGGGGEDGGDGDSNEGDCDEGGGQATATRAMATTWAMAMAMRLVGNKKGKKGLQGQWQW
jgi:hypothetical protein